MTKRVPLPARGIEPEQPEKGTAYYVLLDCPCGCGYTECHIFLFAAPMSPELAAIRAVASLGSSAQICIDDLLPIRSNKTFLGLSDTYQRMNVHADSGKFSYAFKLLSWLRYEHERKESQK